MSIIPLRPSRRKGSNTCQANSSNQVSKVCTVSQDASAHSRVVSPETMQLSAAPQTEKIPLPAQYRSLPVIQYPRTFPLTVRPDICSLRKAPCSQTEALRLFRNTCAWPPCKSCSSFLPHLHPGHTAASRILPPDPPCRCRRPSDDRVRLQTDCRITVPLLSPLCAVFYSI